MPPKNAVELYDAQFARKQQSTGLSPYIAPAQQQRTAPQISPEVQKKLLDALAKEAEKARAREEERRKRDPTYRPDAMDLSYKQLKPFDKYIDYYERLGVSEFASEGELKAAFKGLSLQLHPDKQSGKTDAEAATAKARYFEVVDAFTVLIDLPTRRVYDQQRDKRAAAEDAGLADAGKCDKPPPTCVDVPVSIEQVYKGARLHVQFARSYFAGTKYERVEREEIFTLKVNRGEPEGATYWHRSQGDVGREGRTQAD